MSRILKKPGLGSATCSGTRRTDAEARVRRVSNPRPLPALIPTPVTETSTRDDEPRGRPRGTLALTSPRVSTKVLWGPPATPPCHGLGHLSSVRLVPSFLRCQDWSLPYWGIWDDPAELSHLPDAANRVLAPIHLQMHTESQFRGQCWGEVGPRLLQSSPEAAPLGARISGLHCTAMDSFFNVCLHVT